MITGIFYGLAAATCNSVCYLCSVFFLKKYPSTFKLLVIAYSWMFFLSLPILLIVWPKENNINLTPFYFLLPTWCLVFCFAQYCFFNGLKCIEASRFSSLLGLKIIVLTIIYAAINFAIPNVGKISAVLLATIAAYLINSTAPKGENVVSKSSLKGIFFVAGTLVFYCLADIIETRMMVLLQNSGISNLRSSFIANSLSYATIGFLSLPLLFKVKFDKEALKLNFPYAVLWLLSQYFLLACFGLVLPVFANVILASRGIISVVLGALLCYFGYKSVDADIPLKMWIKRAIAAIIMITAIALYAFSSK
jgi:hypothetical protein